MSTPGAADVGLAAVMVAMAYGVRDAPVRAPPVMAMPLPSWFGLIVR